jgi:hypothetical protein
MGGGACIAVEPAEADRSWCETKPGIIPPHAPAHTGIQPPENPPPPALCRQVKKVVEMPQNDPLSLMDASRCVFVCGGGQPTGRCQKRQLVIRGNGMQAPTHSTPPTGPDQSPTNQPTKPNRTPPTPGSATARSSPRCSRSSASPSTTATCCWRRAARPRTRRRS